jgi:hypothetical protein
VALGKGRRRSERAKIDATPPWEVKKAVETEPTTGPFDIKDASALISGPNDGQDAEGAHPVANRIDFGCLQVPTDSGLELRVEVSEAGTPSSVTLSNPNGTMQLGVFAAPRTEGIWDEVRAEIRESLDQQGGSAKEASGPFGAELVGKVPQSSGLAPVRFLGVDGPRWFLRAMLVGPAAVDAAAGKVFERAFRGLVVVRGDTPLPVREPVPLVLPKEIADQVAGVAAPSPDAAALGAGVATIRRPRR